MQHVAPFVAPRESIFAVLASTARRMSSPELGSIAIVSGAVALAAVILGRAPWTLLAACFVVWCYAGWGILSRSAVQRSRYWRPFELLITGSAVAVFVSMAVGVFFWALGSHWQL